MIINLLKKFMSDKFNEMTEFFAIKDEEYSNDNGSGDDLFVLNDENWEPKEDANLLFLWLHE